MKPIVIIQARMGSSRLPNKMMLYLHGHPVIKWVCQRVAQSKNIQKAIVALPNTESNDLLDEYLSKLGVTVFRGSETDLVERYYFAAIEYEAEEIVRVCADRPLISPSEIDRLIEFYFQSNCDYVYNHIPVNSLNPTG